MQEQESIIQTKSFDFATRVVRMYQWITKKHRIHSLADQVLRSGTSVGANVEEATGALTKKEFIAKIGIAYKEARETRYWLRLLGATDYLNDKMYGSMLADCQELIRILASIQKTSQRNVANQKLKG
ncbi:four helix bundle protein [Spirosoma montaniterrae]|uniref:Four helix bundle protein n=1 Tax=Spirosoma montaniterrae TaxID=1178516 RepID=A0A1P9X225_9BACT|nr:four helix bundle protein [Spirosoma montaniterrae]AQG81671.1 four helix bundle protein [Spirosoma montaniterrae]